MASFLRTSRLRALRHPWLATFFAAVAVVGVLYFVAAVSVAELLRPMYDPVQHTISELAVGRDGWIQVSAFVMLGVSLLALQHGLWRRLRATLLSRSGLILLALCAAATFVAAAFPTDLKGSVVHTVSGDVHAWTASVGYGCLILGALLLSIHFRHDPHWRSYHRPSLALVSPGHRRLDRHGTHHQHRLHRPDPARDGAAAAAVGAAHRVAALLAPAPASVGVAPVFPHIRPLAVRLGDDLWREGAPPSAPGRRRAAPRGDMLLVAVHRPSPGR